MSLSGAVPQLMAGRRDLGSCRGRGQETRAQRVVAQIDYGQRPVIAAIDPEANPLGLRPEDFDEAVPDLRNARRGRVAGYDVSLRGRWIPFDGPLPSNIAKTACGGW